MIHESQVTSTHVYSGLASQVASDPTPPVDVHLLLNDITYLMDESFRELRQIRAIQTEMHNASREPLYYGDRENMLQELEKDSTRNIPLMQSKMKLLADATARTKEAFLKPEIVDRLATMLDHNLEALVGPECQDLLVENPQKYSFDPRGLLSDVLQVLLNLNDQEGFMRAVAADGSGYRKELYERAVSIARKRALKTEPEFEQLRMFVARVEETRAMMDTRD